MPARPTRGHEPASRIHLWQGFCALCYYDLLPCTETDTATTTLMTDERRFEELLTEFERVGVDLNSFPAGITVHRDDALRVLRSLPDGAGPAAFLRRLREEHRRTPAEGTEQQAATEDAA